MLDNAMNSSQSRTFEWVKNVMQFNYFTNLREPLLTRFAADVACQHKSKEAKTLILASLAEANSRPMVYKKTVYATFLVCDEKIDPFFFEKSTWDKYVPKEVLIEAGASSSNTGKAHPRTMNSLPNKRRAIARWIKKTFQLFSLEEPAITHLAISMAARNIDEDLLKMVVIGSLAEAYSIDRIVVSKKAVTARTSLLREAVATVFYEDDLLWEDFIPKYILSKIEL